MASTRSVCGTPKTFFPVTTLSRALPGVRGKGGDPSSWGVPPLRRGCGLEIRPGAPARPWRPPLVSCLHLSAVALTPLPFSLPPSPVTSFFSRRGGEEPITGCGEASEESSVASGRRESHPRFCSHAERVAMASGVRRR